MANLSRYFRRSAQIVVALAAVSVTVVAFSAGQDPPKKTPIESKMREKLTASATVLEGLATEDATLVEEGSKVLTELSKAEVWQVLKDSDYREHTQGFRSAIRRMEDAVKEKEFASAQLEWLEATKKCFDCHNHIRRVRANSKQ